MKDYAFLKPIQVGGMMLKNRIILPAMAKYFCGPDGYINDRYIAYYENLAKGGTALLTTGIMPVDPDWGFIAPGQPFISDDKYIPQMKKLVDTVHNAGSKLVFQPWHSGQVGTGITVDSYSRKEIHQLQKRFVDAARRAKQAGADGVEFHMAHTYLGNQFMSPAFNRRSDEYGAQNPENAARFSLECIWEIRRELCDDGFILTVKLNGNDFADDGVTPDWAARIAVLLEQEGVDLITVSGGGRLTDLGGMSDNGKRPEGWKVDWAAQVKQAVSIPVAASGSIRNPSFADACIRDGKCDIIALGRGILAEPEWVNKVQQGREEEMRICISCMHCFNRTEPGESGCSVNPFGKRELEKPELVKDGAGRKVVIIGAGPAGLEAAVTLAERGFVPEVFEKECAIGGQLVPAAVPPGKQKLAWHTDYYQRQIQRLGITVHLDTEATAEMVRQMSPCAVVVAAGSREAVPPIEGISQPHVWKARDVLKGTEASKVQGKNIVVLGGGMTGIETARFLQRQGGKAVVLEMQPKPEALSVDMELTLRDAAQEGVGMYYNHRVLRVCEAQVEAMDITKGVAVEFPAEIVVVALGASPLQELYQELSETLEQVYAVGDCVRVGTIAKAVQDGSTVGYRIN